MTFTTIDLIDKIHWQNQIAKLFQLNFGTIGLRAWSMIEMDVFPGRSLDAKRNLYKTIVQRLEKLDIKPNDVLIILNEPPLDHWGVHGGIPANEIDLGFKLDV